MKHCIATLKTKEVINKKDGCRLGHVCDVEIDCATGQVVNIVVCRGGRTFSPYACERDLRIAWCDVDVVGNDIILVCYTAPPPPPRTNDCSKRGFGFFR